VSDCTTRQAIFASAVHTALDYASRMGAHIVSMSLGSNFVYGQQPLSPPVSSLQFCSNDTVFLGPFSMRTLQLRRNMHSGTSCKRAFQQCCKMLFLLSHPSQPYPQMYQDWQNAYFAALQPLASKNVLVVAAAGTVHHRLYCQNLRCWISFLG
jgi:hypothetical protein